MNAILGVLKTEHGLAIKDEILLNLNMHDFTIIEQEPPGIQYEFPALKCAIELSIKINKPILYLHTKGAFNEIPPIPKNPEIQSMATFIPPNATLKDWQPCVRKMWYHEFGKNIDKYIEAVKGDEPIVACPYTGSCKATWLNGFIMNSAAAKEIQKIFKFTTNRYWYEFMFSECKTVQIKGLIYNTNDKAEIYKSIWSFIDYKIK